MGWVWARQHTSTWGAEAQGEGGRHDPGPPGVSWHVQIHTCVTAGRRGRGRSTPQRTPEFLLGENDLSWTVL